MCRRRSKNVLQDARSYAGAKIYTDHKIVMARLDLSKPYMIHRRNQTCTQFDISHLTCNRNTQLQYQHTLNTKLRTEDLDATIGPTSKFENLLSVVKSTAAEIVGTRKPHQRANYSGDCKVVELVKKRKLLRLQLNTNCSDDRTGIRSQINRTQKVIKHHLRDIKAQAAENLTNTITSTDESRPGLPATLKVIKSHKKELLTLKVIKSPKKS